MGTHETLLLEIVSGANCALVTSGAIWALSWLGAGRRLRAVAAGVALAGFVVVVGPDASVQRAAIMGAVLLASNFGGNRATALPALGIAIAVLLVLDPWQAWHPGFALSVVATGGIILCAPAFTEALRRVARIPAWVALPFAVAAAAQLACGPLLLLLQDGIPAAGLLANVLAGPAAPAGTALGLLALLAAPVSGAAAHTLVWLASLPARWVEETARITAGLPGARWEWVTGVPGALLLTAAEVLAIVAWLLASGRLTRHETRVRRPWEPDIPGPRVLRTWVSVLAGCAAGVFVGPTLVAPAVEQAGTPADWVVVACDVGQGDALLLRGPDARPGEAVLVDTGDDDKLLRDCLRLFGVTRIALLVLTHDHLDHTGALDAVAAITETALIGPAARNSEAPADHAAASPLHVRLAARGVPTGVTGAGAVGSHAGVDWFMLAPDPLLTPASANDSSLVMRAEMGERSVLLLGDTGEESQAMLANAMRRAGNETLLQADTVKVAHHGSRDQREGIYKTVGATLALVSSGAGNSYGHPAPGTLSALASAGTRVLRTDELGSIAVLAGERPGAGTHPDPALPRIWASRGGNARSDE
ncbi:ComEC/Rec2 family competence protein [Leucobacter sp. HY1910]